VNARYRFSLVQLYDNVYKGATSAEKLRGTKVWVPTPGRLLAKGRAVCWVREGVAPSRCEGPGVSTRKIFENSDAKSCILVITVLMNGLPKT